jgi:hypothetical protein
MGTDPAAAGIGPVAEDAVIAVGTVIDVPAATVRFTPVVSAVVGVRALGIDQADAPVHVLGAVKPPGGAGIADMLAHAEQAVVIAVAELVVLAALTRLKAGALISSFNTGGIRTGAAGVDA